MERNLLLQEILSSEISPMFVLKPMDEEHKQNYMQLLSENSSIKNSPLCEIVWEEMWQRRISEDLITYSILSPKTQEFMGYCQYKNLSTNKPDIGIELLPQFQHQGLGYAVCCALISVFFEKTSFSEIYYKVERRNTPSIALVEKLGGTRNGVNYSHEHLLSIFNSLSLEEITKLGRNAPEFIPSLEKYISEQSKEEHSMDILVYQISRDIWMNK